MDLRELEGQLTDIEARLDHLSKERKPPPQDFEEVVAAIRKRDNCSHTEALQKARSEVPAAFEEYQNRSPATNADFDALVEGEMRKGLPRSIAGQRVLLKHGISPNGPQVQKRQSAALDFMAEVDAVVIEKRCSRTAAMSEVRQRHPDLYQAFQEA